MEPIVSDPLCQGRGARQIACYLLLASVFIYLMIQRMTHPVTATGDNLPVANRVGDVQTAIDPNRAPWQELARLPDVGESLARAIVSYREQQQARLASQGRSGVAVFQSIQDLDPVPGIGEKRLKRLEPFLRFPPSASSGPQD